jgi:hypothetical protein
LDAALLPPTDDAPSSQQAAAPPLLLCTQGLFVRLPRASSVNHLTVRSAYGTFFCRVLEPELVQTEEQESEEECGDSTTAGFEEGLVPGEDPRPQAELARRLGSFIMIEKKGVDEGPFYRMLVLDVTLLLVPGWMYFVIMKS